MVLLSDKTDLFKTNIRYVNSTLCKSETIEIIQKNKINIENIYKFFTKIQKYGISLGSKSHGIF